MTTDGFHVPRWVSGVIVVTTLGLVVWVILRDRPALDTFANLDPTDLIVILVLQVLYLLPESQRQKIVIESSSDVSIASVRWFKIFAVGRFLNTFVPQSGNVYRALKLKREFGIAIADFGGGMAAFVIMSVTTSLAVAAPFLAVQSPSQTIFGLPAPLVLILAAGVVAGAPFAIRRLVRPLQDRESPAGIIDAARRVATAALTALQDVRLILRFIAVWFVTIIIVVTLYRAVFGVIDWNLGIGEAIAIYALLQASSFIVLTPGNLGIQELGLAALAALFGIPAAVGALAAALIRATGWIALALPAVAFGFEDIVRFSRRREP